MANCREAFPALGFSEVRWVAGKLEALIQWEGEQWIGHGLPHGNPSKPSHQTCNRRYIREAAELTDVTS